MPTDLTTLLAELDAHYKNIDDPYLWVEALHKLGHAYPTLREAIERLERACDEAGRQDNGGLPCACEFPDPESTEQRPTIECFFHECLRTKLERAMKDRDALCVLVAQQREALRELLQAMQDYQMDVDDDPPRRHRAMMEKARAVLAQEVPGGSV